MEQSMAEYNFFNLSIEGAVAHLSLDNPAQSNCLTDAFWSELPQVVDQLGRDASIRVVLITGEGKHFCAGMDLSSFDFITEVSEGEPGRGAFTFYNRIRELQAALDSLEQSRLVTIAAVHGACIGGAIDLISACDIRIASDETRFSVEEINVGMAADVGTLQRLPRLIAPGIARELAYTGRKFTAQEALGWGFINSAHDGLEATRTAARELAETIAAKSPLALAGTKRAITYGLENGVADGLDQIATWNAGMLRPEDLNTALSAMKEKRKAEFADLRSDS